MVSLSFAQSSRQQDPRKVKSAFTLAQIKQSNPLELSKKLYLDALRKGVANC